MGNNKDRAYLVIAEIERVGFLAGSTKKYLDAVELANELLLYGELFPYGETTRIRTQLRNRQFREYQIKGNQIFFDKGIYGSTDGKYSVVVLSINLMGSAIETFIRERENYSIAFNPEQYSNKKWSRYFDDFPSSIHKAN